MLKAMDQGVSVGAAYLFDVASGEELVKLVLEDGKQDDYFGCSVELSNDRAYVGSLFGDSNGLSRTGLVAVYDVAQVPEPSSLVMLAGGLLAAWAVVARRR